MPKELLNTHFRIFLIYFVLWKLVSLEKSSFSKLELLWMLPNSTVSAFIELVFISLKLTSVYGICQKIHILCKAYSHYKGLEYAPTGIKIRWRDDGKGPALAGRLTRFLGATLWAASKWFFASAVNDQLCHVIKKKNKQNKTKQKKKKIVQCPFNTVDIQNVKIHNCIFCDSGVILIML